MSASLHTQFPLSTYIYNLPALIWPEQTVNCMQLCENLCFGAYVLNPVPNLLPSELLLAKQLE